MARAQPVKPVEIPVTPSAEVWRSMSPAQREAHLVAVYAALEQEHIQAGAGVRHFRTKTGAFTTLNGHFRRVEKRLFLACELPTL